MNNWFSYVFLYLGYTQHMRTYENTKIYKVVNDVDSVTFFGYTCMSLPSRLSSPMKECNNPACSGAVYEHMRAVGEEHVKLASLCRVVSLPEQRRSGGEDRDINSARR